MCSATPCATPSTREWRASCERPRPRGRRPFGADRRRSRAPADPRRHRLRRAPRRDRLRGGRIGSGKSVTALSIMGLLPRGGLTPTGGRILVDGEDVLAASAARLRALRATRMAMVFQEPMTALNPVHRVGKQIDEVLRRHTTLNWSERRERVFSMLDAVHLSRVAQIYDAYPHQLSGGQRQRIVISMALILEPKLLIADEPTTALDVTTQAQILSLIRELQEKHNTAVMFITHDFGVVAEIAERIVVMNCGRVVEVGQRTEILVRPRQAYTRMLVSSVPSLIPRRRERPSGEIILDVADLSKTYVATRLFTSGRTVAAAKDVNLTIRRGEIVGLVGEFGLRQVNSRALHRSLDRSDFGQHPRQGPRYCRGRAPTAASLAPPLPDCLSGSLSIAQPAPAGRRLDCRRLGEFRNAARRGLETRARVAGSRRDRSRRHAAISSPILGRATTTHLHRARACARARPSGRG